MIWTGNGGKSSEIKWPQVKSNPVLAGHSFGMDKVQTQLFDNYPTASAHRIFFARDSVAAIMDIPYQKEDIIDSWRYFDQYSGEQLDELMIAEMTSGEKLYFYGYSLHVGSILSLPGKILAFFASLVSASLPITGFFIWWNKRKKEGDKTMKSNRNSIKNQNNQRPKLVKKANSKELVEDYEEVGLEM